MSGVVLLTWNPGPADAHVYDPDAWVREVVEPCRAGQAVASTWGVGRHKHGIGPGVPAVLHRQGAHGRGLVARGEITSTVLTGERTRTPGRVTNYVELVWHEAVPVDLRLDVRDLELAVPDVGWRHVYSSGRTLAPDLGAALLAEWDLHLGDVGGPAAG